MTTAADMRAYADACYQLLLDVLAADLNLKADAAQAAADALPERS